MRIENFGVVYYMSEEDVAKAIHYYLTVALNQKIGDVIKTEPSFEKEYYSVGQFEESYREIFDGVKVVYQ